MQIPQSSHVIWKLIFVFMLFSFLTLSKYLGYDQWDEIKDLRAAIIETTGVIILFICQSSIKSSK